MNETLLTVFAVFVCLAILAQLGLLVVLFLAMKKYRERMESMANEVESRLLPVLDSAREILQDSAPKLKELTANLADVSVTLKSQMVRIDATLNDVVDRTRLQVIRLDEMVGRTLDKVEETTEMVQNTVATPVRHLTGIIQGLTVGIGAYLQGRRKGGAQSVRVAEDEELFI